MVISIDVKKFVVVFLIISAFAGGFLVNKFSSSSSSSSSSSDYPLINKTVTAGVTKHFIINFKPLKVELEKIQKKYHQKTYVYFSYLNNPAWIGLNERDEFVAASTIKVPLAMVLLKTVEERKLQVSDSYALDQFDLDANFGKLYEVGADKEFTIEEFLKIMLEQSDNTAMQAISHILKLIGIDDPFGNIYNFLGWDSLTIPSMGEVHDYSKINLKTLANVFVALYDAKYLNVKNSDKILEYLTNTPFDDKIAAGVPKGVTVSHKIGIATQDKTFSDCGIIYAPNRHYLLCLGSNGGEEKVAAKFMTEISRAVYKYVINN